ASPRRNAFVAAERGRRRGGCLPVLESCTARAIVAAMLNDAILGQQAYSPPIAPTAARKVPALRGLRLSRVERRACRRRARSAGRRPAASREARPAAVP